jgi:S-formylglutathione hydrolase
MSEATSILIEDQFDAASVGAPVGFRVLLPADWVQGERLPLVLHLHAAMSSSASLELARPVYDELRVRGAFPRAVVACVSTPTQHGFYIDWPDAAWEALIETEFPELVGNRYGPFAATALIGASMGGYGALKLAFAQPERFAGVAAISPAVFPGEAPRDVPARNLQSVLGDLHDAMSRGTGDPAIYAANSVYGRARANRSRIRNALLPVLIDCGAADEFLLHQGAAHLHRVLNELGIRHEYRLVEGAGHLGPAADTRTADAITFIGRALTRSGASSLSAPEHERPPQFSCE